MNDQQARILKECTRQLYGVTAILRLIDESEGYGGDANVYSAADAASQIVDRVTSQLAEIDSLEQS